ncbi:hypothetical protein D3C76_824400 [compost metagenome]
MQAFGATDHFWAIEFFNLTVIAGREHLGDFGVVVLELGADALGVGAVAGQQTVELNHFRRRALQFGIGRIEGAFGRGNEQAEDQRRHRCDEAGGQLHHRHGVIAQMMAR